MAGYIGGTHVWRGRAELRRDAAALDAALAATGAEVSARRTAIAVWLAHHPDEEPLVIAIRDDGAWTAVAVLSIAVRRGVAVVSSATEPGTYAAVTAVGPSAAAQLADALIIELTRAHRRWTVRLGMLRDVDPVTAALFDRVRYARIESGDGAPRLVFQPGSDARRYLSRNTRATVARSVNRLDRAGHQLELSWLTSPAQAREALPEVVDVHRRRNRQLRGQAMLDDPSRGRYFSDMVIGHAEAGRLDLLTARVGADLAAFAVCFTADSTRWVYANLVAPEWTGFSVGTITNAEVVRRSHGQPGVRCLDWGGGRQRYKLSGDAETVEIHLFEGWSSWSVRAASRLPGLNIVRKLGRLVSSANPRRVATLAGQLPLSRSARH